MTNTNDDRIKEITDGKKAKKRNLGGSFTAEKKRYLRENSFSWSENTKPVEINENAEIKVAVYKRISKMKEESVTFERQDMETRKFAMSEGIDFDQVKVVYFTEEGGAYKNRVRPEFDKMINAIKDAVGTAEPFTHLYVYEIARLFRKVNVKNKVTPVFERSRIKLRIQTMPSIKLDGSLADSMIYDIMAQMAQYSSTETSMRAKGAHEIRVDMGVYRGGFTPYGLKLVESNDIRNNSRTFEPDTEPNPENPAGISNAEVVQMIFKMCLEGYTQTKISRYLNENKYPTNFGAEYWDHQTVRYILKNSVYAGYNKYKGEIVIKNGEKMRIHSPLITDENFEEVQMILTKRKKVQARSEHIYLLVGTVMCGRCGSRMYGKLQLRAGKGERATDKVMYICNKHQQQPQICKANGIGKLALENTLKHYIIGLLSDKELLKNLDKFKIDENANNAFIEKYNAQKAELEQRIAAEKYEDLKEMLVNKLDKLQDSIKANEVRINNKDIYNVQQFTKNEIEGMWERKDTDAIAVLLNTMIAEIKILPFDIKTNLNDAQLRNKGWLANYNRINIVYIDGTEVNLGEEMGAE